jgi:hypothetical protein
MLTRIVHNSRQLCTFLDQIGHGLSKPNLDFRIIDRPEIT